MPLSLLALLTMHSSGQQIPSSSEFSAPLVRMFEAEWPNNRTVTIVCHGHSVPAGYFKTPVVQSFDAYPHLLHEAIKKKFPNAVVNVIVTAIGGENAESGAKRFDHDVMSLRPDVVTIDYALNDRGIGLERARASWQSMIDTAKKGHVLVVLLTPSWDQSVHPERPGDPLNQHAVQVRELAKTNGVGLADSFQAYLDARDSGTKIPDLMSQVNHPNRAGHELILKKLLPWFGITST